jgi:gliding motility-associated-like protein
MKQMHPDASAWVKKIFVFTLAFFILNQQNSLRAQCVVATESSPNQVNPSGCNNGNLSLGPGAYYNVTVNANTYYNFSWLNVSSCINGFCAQPLNGNAVAFSTTPTTGWFSGTTTSLQISANATGCWDGNSGLLTYRYTQPTISTATATPNPVCQGNTLNLNSSSNYASTLSWSGPNSFSASGASATNTNMQSADAGVYTFSADNSGCSATLNTSSVTVNPLATATAGGPDAVCQSASPSAITLSGASIGGSATTGAWSILSGGGTLSSTSQTATPSSITYTPAPNFNGTVTLQLTTDDPSGPCGAATSTRTITVYSLPLVAPSSNSPVCTGNQINLNANASGGLPAYSYNWNGPSSYGSSSPSPSLANASSLMAGVYYVTVTDQHLCSSSGSTSVSVNPLPNGSISGSTTICAGTSTNITFNFSTGTGPFNISYTDGSNIYSLNGVSNGGTASVSPPVGNTTYQFTSITDANGCVRTTGFLGGATITVTAAPSFSSVTHTNVLCNGGNTGTITITASSSNTPLTYSDDNGVTYQSSNVFAGLIANSYTVVVKDNIGCTKAYALNPVVVSQPAVLSNVSTPTDASCANVFDGKISISASGGTAPYTYSLNGGPSQTGSLFTGLSAGSYTTYVYDANGCVTTQNVTVSNSYIVAVSVVTQTDVSCYGGSDGSVTVDISGGTPPYSYSINGSIFQSSPVFTNLSATTYIVTLRDSRGCTDYLSVAIQQPAQLQINVDNVTNALCYGTATGAINITVTGGTAPYFYSWSNNTTNEDPGSLAAGTYTVTVTDSKGCFTTTGATVSQPTALSFSIASYHDLKCYNDSSGSIDISVNGGVAPYSFSWSNGATTEDIYNLYSADYTVTVTDNNGCPVYGEQFIAQPTQLTSSVSVTDVSCNGYSNGAVDLTVYGGTAAYAYIWNNGATTQDLTNVTAGSYNVIITDAHGCITTNVTTVSQLAALSLSTVVTNVTCNGTATGAVDLTVTGGTGTYSYLWNNNAVTQDLSGVLAGNYSVTVTDGNSCSASVAVSVVEPSQPLTANAVATDVTCNGTNDGSVGLFVSGGTTPYVFSWDNLATTQNISGLGAGDYSVTVTDANGCNAFADATVNEPAALTATIQGSDVTCFGGNDGLATVTNVSGGNPAYSYFWNTFETSSGISNLAAGNYAVVVNDSKGCQVIKYITISQPPVITITSSVSSINCFGETGNIDLTVTGGSGNYTYTWNNNATTQDLSGVTAGTYSVTVYDANNCSATASFIITQPAAMVLNGTPVSVACAGGANGSIAITVNGGVFPYAYLWSTNATTQNVNGLSGGTYTVTVTDANGCTISQSFVINEPGAISSSITGVNPTCFGANTGSADLNVNGGAQPYSYLWSTFQATQDLNNLTAGTYYVIITDANGCTKRDSVILTQPLPLLLSTSVTDVTCNGGTDGAVDLTVTGGTGTYTYAWDNNYSGQNLSDVIEGTYNVTVYDANNCSATASGVVSEPALLIATGTKVDVHCAGSTDGSISLQVTGGVLPYTFLWSNNATTQNLANLAANTYIVTVTDAHGCNTTAQFVISEPSPIISSVSGTNVSCNGLPDGTATLSVSGGVLPYTFFWSNFQSSQNISGLSGGTYYVIITDAAGCTHRDSVIISEPTPIYLTTLPTNVTCNNANDGIIDLTVSGGSPAYQYLWSNNATTQDVSSLAGGTYTVTVTDAHGCTATTYAIIINPSALSDNYVTHNALCFGDANGSIDLIPSGGTPNYTFLWSTTATTEDVNGLAAGTYYVTITDTKGCIKSDSVVITEPGPLYTNGIVKNVSCNNYCDGAVFVTAYGGTLPYSYTWSSQQSIQNITQLCGGDYFLTLTDANNCFVVSDYNVVNPAVLSLNVSGTNVTCFGGTNGTAVASATGGTIPYHFVWDDFVTDTLRSGLTAGAYHVMLTDSFGCQRIDSIVLTQPTEILITGTVTDATCFNAATGAIDISVSGGNPSYTYLWTNTATTQDLAAVQAGNYSVTVTDTTGCTKAASYVIGQPTEINLTVLSSKPSCHGSNNGSLSVVAIQGVTPYSYAWSTTPAQTTATASDLYAGSYTVTVTDSKGCTVSVSQNLQQPDSIVVTTNAQASRCFNTATGKVIATTTGGVSPLTYELNGVVQTSDTFTGLFPGNYAIEVQDVNGCTAVSSFSISQPGQITVSLGTTQQVILTGMNTELVATATSSSAITHYFWNPDSVVDYSLCVDPSNCATPYVHPASTTIFTVTVMNADSCFASDTITIYVTNTASRFVPTAFTPNGDGLNDRFEFDFLGATNIDIAIYDRWGSVVYSNPNQLNGITGTHGWDGKVNGKDAPYDTYVYRMKVTYFDSSMVDVTGTVTIMK